MAVAVTSNILSWSIIGASGFLLPPCSLDCIGTGSGSPVFSGRHCAKGHYNHLRCPRGRNLHVCTSGATKRPTSPETVGFESLSNPAPGASKITARHDSLGPPDFSSSAGRTKEEELGVGGTSVRNPRHQEEEIRRAGVDDTVQFVESRCEDIEDTRCAEEEFGREDILQELQNAVDELEIEVEKLRQENTEEDDDHVILGTCRFSREGKTRSPATQSRDLLLYLPGVGGLNIEAREQFDFLSASFDTWCMTVDGSDRSSFEDLYHEIREFLDVVGVTEERRAVLVGSSFGGLLALKIAHQCKSRLRGLVLVNPATSFNGSAIHRVGSFVAHAPSPEMFGATAVLALAASIPDTAMASRYMREFEALPPQEVPVRLKDLADEWLGLTMGLFSGTAQDFEEGAGCNPNDEVFYITANKVIREDVGTGIVFLETLRWRLKHWLGEGTQEVEPLLCEITLPVLVLAGGEDHILPSVDEAERLSHLIPSCQKIILRGVGHAALHDPGEVDLRKLISSSVLYDDILLARVLKSKGAKLASERRYKEDMIGNGKNGKQQHTTSDPMMDFKLDMGDATVELAWKTAQVMDRFTSPVFLSMNESGQLEDGLGGVPDFQEGRSILFVGNHQLLGIDMPILVRKLLVEKNILVRGLAHPMVSGSRDTDFLGKMKQNQAEQEQADCDSARRPVRAVRKVASSVVHVVGAAAGRTEAAGLTGVRGVVGAAKSVTSTASSVLNRVVRGKRKGGGGDNNDRGFQRHEQSPSTLRERVSVILSKLGAVSVTPQNMLALLRAGESVLLYPGGAKEALHQKGEEYQIFWPQKGEFVRMAAACNATIVPFAAVGAADSMEILMDLDDIFSLPFGLGEQLHTAAGFMPRARGSDEDEYFVPPLALPKVPARHYFVFGRPIDTTAVDKSDREACQKVYDRAKLSVESGIDYLLEAREQDPYGYGAKRLMYETVLRTQAPTFPLDAATTDGFGCVGEHKKDNTETSVRVQRSQG